MQLKAGNLGDQFYYVPHFIARSYKCKQMPHLPCLKQTDEFECVSISSVKQCAWLVQDHECDETYW
jgi:hypothetical protein